MQTVKLDEGLYRTDADNGVTVISERMSGVRSVSVGVWVRRASVHEARPKMGVSHLLEHMVFKGTERRSAKDIALELETRGGSLDAFTARDYTSFQARILDEDLPRALDVLTDLVRNPALRDADLEMERYGADRLINVRYCRKRVFANCSRVRWLRDFCGSQSCVVRHSTARLSVDAA